MRKTLKTQLLVAVAMLIIAAVALTGATYAWFSISANPTVGNIDLNVKGGEGLLLSAYVTPTLENHWSTSLSQADIVGQQANAFPTSISDVSTCDATIVAGNFFDAVIDPATKVPGSYVAAPSTDGNREYVKFTLHAKTTKASATLTLMGSETTSTTPNTAHSFVRGATEADPAKTDAQNPLAGTVKDGIAATVRVGFVSGSNSFIWEPNSKIAVNGTTEALGTRAAKLDIEGVKTAGALGTATFDDQTTFDFTANNQKVDLFAFPAAGGTVTFDVYIWVEGVDADTMNAVAESYFRTFLKFGLKD